MNPQPALDLKWPGESHKRDIDESNPDIVNTACRLSPYPRSS